MRIRSGVPSRVGLSMALAVLSAPAQSQTIAGRGEPIDGDSLIVGGTEVRLFGIDAPEGRQQCRRSGDPWACGEEARTRLSAFIDGRTIRCQAQDSDGYGRTVATCTAGTLDLGGAMVEAGYAVALVEFSSAYVGDEQRARSARLGIWSSEFETLAAWRAAHAAEARPRPAQTERTARRAPAPTTQSPGGCLIKGNRSRRGEWIYHLPGMPDYEETRPEQWFCTEAQAIAAGYRRSRAH